MQRQVCRRTVLKGVSASVGVGFTALAVPLRAQATVANALDFVPQALHAEILAGTSTTDVSGYLNEGLASHLLLALPPFGQLSIASSLVVPSFGGLLGVNYGCTIRALPNFGNKPMVRNVTIAPPSNEARDRNLVLTSVRLDGNKAQNGSATEFAHGIQLYAVDGVKLDVQVVNPKGDGVSIQQAVDHQQIGCSYISGKIRTMGCRRQGVAIICGEQIDLDVHDTGGTLMSVDMEPDHPQNFIRNVFVRLLSIGTGNGSDISGGVCVAGDGLGCIPTNVMVDFEIFNSGGQGAIWRDAKGLILRGTIVHPGKNGLVGITGGTAPSTVTFGGVKVFSPVFQGLSAREIGGSIYDGEVAIESAGDLGAHIERAGGGTLGLRIRNCNQQGLVLDRTNNMTFPSLTCENNKGHNVWLRGGSQGNRFQFLKSVNSSFGQGFIEDAGCNDNRAFQARVSGNGGGNVTVRGLQSSVQLES